MTITIKNTIQCYQLRELEHGCWADIYIDEGKDCGALLIRSDYGDWSYFWNSYSGTFKEFLCNIGTDYLTGKLMHGREMEFRLDKWMKSAKEIIDADKDISPDTYGLLKEELEEMDSSDITSSGGLWLSLKDYEALHEYFIPDNMPRTDFVPSLLERFLEEAWAPFIEELKKEIIVAA